MTGVSTTAKLNGKTVTTGDKIVAFDGREFTFDYMLSGYVYVKERDHGFTHRVFPAAAVKKTEPTDA